MVVCVNGDGDQGLTIGDIISEEGATEIIIQNKNTSNLRT